MPATPVVLTDAIAKREALSPDKPRIVRDAKIPGFHLWIGKKSKSLRYQFEERSVAGQRGKTQVITLGEVPLVSVSECRDRAIEMQLKRARGEPVIDLPEPAAARQATLQDAWQSYKASLERKARSPRTIADYEDKFDRHLADWHDRPMASITRAEVVEKHATITEKAKALRAGQRLASGKYAANGTMRFGRALWNHALDELEVAGMPNRNPFRAKNLFHKEKARKTGMGSQSLSTWNKQRLALENPIRRELHLFMLLSGLRRTDAVRARWSDLKLNRPSLAVPAPKGGEDRAFELPLSKEMVNCLERLKEAGQTYYPKNHEWIFPSDAGHISEVKEPVSRLTHTGHKLRHSYRTLAGEAGADRFRLKILLNHAVSDDVTDDYANVEEMFGTLVALQERISSFIVAGLNAGPTQ